MDMIASATIDFESTTFDRFARRLVVVAFAALTALALTGFEFREAAVVLAFDETLTMALGRAVRAAGFAFRAVVAFFTTGFAAAFFATGRAAVFFAAGLAVAFRAAGRFTVLLVGAGVGAAAAVAESAVAGAAGAALLLAAGFFLGVAFLMLFPPNYIFAIAAEQ